MTESQKNIKRIINCYIRELPDYLIKRFAVGQLHGQDITSCQHAVLRICPQRHGNTGFRIKAHGPFDAALIDGDHLYGGMKEAWDFYGRLATIAAFHDVAGDSIRQATIGLLVEVPRLWREIKASGRKTQELIHEDSGMGIGVVFG